MQDTRTLMNDIFEALYDQDAQVLGEIIKNYGYEINLEEKNEEELSEQTRELASKLTTVEKEELIDELLEGNREKTYSLVKDYLNDVEPDSIKEIVEQATDCTVLTPENTSQMLNLLKGFKDNREAELEDCLINLGYCKIENKGTEENETEDYGKKYIENIVQNKDSQKAIELTELFLNQQLIPDGEETVKALAETNFEQVIDTIMTEVGAEKVFEEVKRQYITHTNGLDNNLLVLDITEPEESITDFLTIEAFKKEIIKELTKENNFREILLQMISNNGLTKVEDEISSYFEKEYGEPKFKKISNVLALDLTNIKLAIETILNNEVLKDEIKKQAKKSLKKEVKELSKKIKTLNEEIPQVRLRGGDDKQYSKFDDTIDLKDFDYKKEMSAVYVDTIDVMVGNKVIFNLKSKRAF